MEKYCKKLSFFQQITLAFSVLCVVIMAISCSESSNRAQYFNDKAYAFRYRNLDSTMYYANKVIELGQQNDEFAEAVNNLSFVFLAKMDYHSADSLLKLVYNTSDNQIELLIADIQMMRMCQRQSKNKDFYVYRESALRRLKRIAESEATLTNHQQDRMIYARSEFNIVSSIYFYYVGLEDFSIDAINRIDATGEILQDTAQYLSYLYTVGSGGIIVNGTREEITQLEFDYLMRCYMLAKQNNYPYWMANSLQAISERIQNRELRNKLIDNNLPSFQFINTYNMPDSLLAGNLAQSALSIFQEYGDVYQVTGGYRTLAECYWAINDYRSALICLKSALQFNKAIDQAPDLVASIREQLSLAYSALDNKQQSDYNRNIYLDLQEKTRQDRQLEARAERLTVSSKQLGRMITAVIVMILLVCALLLVIYFLRKRNDTKASNMDVLLEPLEKWKQTNMEQLVKYQEKCTEIEEEKLIVERNILRNKQQNVEQRTKISLVSSIIPLIDRILHEIKRLTTVKETVEVRNERLAYIAELAEQINQNNNVLTSWIQLRQGMLSLKIESFKLQDIFDLLVKSKMGFQLKGVNLLIEDTELVVKADKTLTLFMMNTLADNARKFTKTGGTVRVYAEEQEKSVMVYVCDTGVGMSEKQIENLFVNKPIQDKTYQNSAQTEVLTQQSGNGFGLMNCKGIIERYKKTSKIFSVCTIGVQSRKGDGTTMFFSLPKGISKFGTKSLLLLMLCVPIEGILNKSFADSTVQVHQIDGYSNRKGMKEAALFADSVYYSNVKGYYRQTLVYADSCLKYLNIHYYKQQPNGVDSMVLFTNSTALPAELVWHYDSISTNFNVILSLRNEIAVAALALHDWKLYNYNNTVYTQLFRELSADNTLSTYVKMMQKLKTNQNVAIILLVLVFASIFPVYYFLYYRHRLFYKFSIDRIKRVNEILLSDLETQTKLDTINQLWNFHEKELNSQSTKLYAIVEQIKDALIQKINLENKQLVDIELLEDELRKMNFENDKLYISNNVLDNCLSTLKHETMYYPSKIKHMVDESDVQIEALGELATYYKDLYILLSTQTILQIDNILRVDNEMINYLFELLTRLNKEKPDIVCQDIDDIYCVIQVKMANLLLTSRQVIDLFTPNTVDMQYMICRQIVREIGDATNARACGIEAIQDENNKIIIQIKITKEVCSHLKLL